MQASRRKFFCTSANFSLFKYGARIVWRLQAPRAVLAPHLNHRGWSIFCQGWIIYVLTLLLSVVLWWQRPVSIFVCGKARFSLCNNEKPAFLQRLPIGFCHIMAECLLLGDRKRCDTQGLTGYSWQRQLYADYHTDMHAFTCLIHVYNNENWQKSDHCLC